MYSFNFDIHNLSSNIAHCEALGLSKCFAAYAHQCAGEDILCVGFNPHSGYVYIALENGVQICSMLGGDVEFLYTDSEDGTEFFYDNYNEAIINSNI
jgi:hypothetical protein